MISCEQCRRAELTPWQRLREDVRAAVLGPPPGRILQARASILSAFVGKTGFDRHRDAYILTGDERELRRMLNHIMEVLDGPAAPRLDEWPRRKRQG